MTEYNATQNTRVLHFLKLLKIFSVILCENDIDFIYIDGCSSVSHINCSLVTPLSGQMQSDSY